MKLERNLFKIKVPNLNKPQEIIIHHALKKKCTIFDIHNWHKGFGWAGFGYHYFISKEGKIYEGRKEKQRGSHCKEKMMNFKSIGICVEGCYQDYGIETDKTMPKEQLEALVWLVKDIQKRHNIVTEKVRKHNYYANYKLCPGNYFPWDKFIEKLKEKGNQDLEKIEDLQEEVKKLEEEVQYLKEKLKQINTLSKGEK